MEFGAHLPLMDFGGHPYTLDHLVAYTKAAAQLGFVAVAVNDHMVFSVPWLDGPVALAATMEHSAEMTLATTVTLVVVRGPVPVAKTLGAIDRLSGGRLGVAVGPGSSPEDYAAVGLDFSERWPRFDEAIGVLRALWGPDGPPFVGRFYSTEGLSVEPRPAQAGGPAIWVGSWALRRGCVVWHASQTAGWRRPTTRRRSCSAELGKPLARNSMITGEIRTRSRTHLRRCGATSPTTQRKPIASISPIPTHLSRCTETRSYP